MSGRLIVIRPDGTHTIHRWTKARMPGQTQEELKFLQGLLGGGFLEHIHVRYEGRVRSGFIDEEGKYKHLPDNMPATQMMCHRQTGDQIVGDLIIWVPDAKPRRRTPPPRQTQRPS